MNQLDYKTIVLTVPAVSALIALLIITFDILNEKKSHRRLKLNLVFYLGCTVFVLLSTFIYFYYPHFLVWINWLYMLCYMLIPVFLYAFIFRITMTDQQERFSPFHFVAPAFLSTLLLVLTFITPYEEQLATITGNGYYVGGSKLFFLVSNGKLFFRLMFSITYLTLSFRRLPRYRAFIRNYSANEKSLLRWVTIYLFFVVCLIPVPLIGLFLPRNSLFTSSYAVFQVLEMIVQHSFLAYHVVSRNYILVEAATPEQEQNNFKSIQTDADKEDREEHTVLKKSILTKSRFENYIQKKKPYLNPELKITDMVADLKINRTYISSFINTQYGMNFNSYINSLRVKEFKHLRQSHQCTGKTDNELAEMAGFNSYRNYKRFVDRANI